MNTLAPEIRFNIYQHLNDTDLGHMAQVNKDLNEDWTLWETLFKRCEICEESTEDKNVAFFNKLRKKLPNSLQKLKDLLKLDNNNREILKDVFFKNIMNSACWFEKEELVNERRKILEKPNDYFNLYSQLINEGNFECWIRTIQEAPQFREKLENFFQKKEPRKCKELFLKYINSDVFLGVIEVDQPDGLTLDVRKYQIVAPPESTMKELSNSLLTKNLYHRTECKVYLGKEDIQRLGKEDIQRQNVMWSFGSGKMSSDQFMDPDCVNRTAPKSNRKVEYYSQNNGNQLIKDCSLLNGFSDRRKDFFFKDISFKANEMPDMINDDIKKGPFNIYDTPKDPNTYTWTKVDISKHFGPVGKVDETTKVKNLPSPDIILHVQE